MKRRAYLASVGGASVGLAVAGCLDVLADDYDVGMTPNAFDPETLTVSVGDTVVWKNTSSRGHTVTAFGGSYPDGAAYWATGGFESEAAAREAWDGGGDDGIIGVGETYSHTFEITGDYGYFCIPHEAAGMDGVVTVEE